eukprot:CAMPEP_0115002200 /NCGR_PEP_ID=MMETSP0216-20121206/17861_1 /TAXON_ID=223996 /ORGANISM="Protocruzia adherens, Strain Boccale" /LENGTH=408 /DNA_ID=CAMNT_0002367743 /DNA_START=28 /DNA_END=1254 /DNA_ORIENTATION=+
MTAHILQSLSLKQFGLPNGVNSDCFDNYKFTKYAFEEAIDIKRLLTAAPSNLQHPSAIQEIVAYGDLLVILTRSEVGLIYNRANHQTQCLNRTGRERVLTIFHNKDTDSLIVVYKKLKPNSKTSLLCRSLDLQELETGSDDLTGEKLFKDGINVNVDVIHFDEPNKKILTLHEGSQCLSVWCLNSYQHLYTIVEEYIQDFRVCHEILVLQSKLKGGLLPMTLIDIEDGKTMNVFDFKITHPDKVEYIENFNEIVLIKVQNKPLKIFNTQTSKMTEAPEINPRAYLFVYDRKEIIVFTNEGCELRNQDGDLMLRFDALDFSNVTDFKQLSFHLTDKRDYLLTYLVEEGDGRICISNVKDGSLVGTIKAKITDDLQQRQALRNVTKLYYDEETDDIIVGTTQGQILIWKN